MYIFMCMYIVCIHRCYGGDCSLLFDVCRELLVCDTLQDLTAILQTLRDDPDVLIMRIKNRLDPDYDSAASAGYRDVLVNICIDNEETSSINVHHHVAELQLILRPVYERRLNKEGEDLILGSHHNGSNMQMLGGMAGGGTMGRGLGGTGAGRRVFAGRGGADNSIPDAALNHRSQRPLHSGHTNYVLWRNLRGM